MSDTRQTILFAGGGTGGHLFPGIAVAEELLRREDSLQILFGGSNKEIEKRIVHTSGYEHLEFAAEPSTSLRRNPVGYLWKMLKACRHARLLLEQIQPAAIVGLGGYASVPIVLGASSMNIPVTLLEQNAVAGRATKLLSRRAQSICLSFPKTSGKLSPKARQIVTGNPVRRTLLEHRSTSEEQPQKQILILGGSQGSVSLNRMVLEAISEFQSELTDWKIVHQTGELDYEQTLQQYQNIKMDYEVAPFFDDLQSLYRTSQFAICRAGATTLAELASTGCPAILVPYPYALGDHQALNALYYQQQGAALIQWENRENDLSLTEQMKRLLSESQFREEAAQSMKSLAKPEAAQEVADIILHSIQ